MPQEMVTILMPSKNGMPFLKEAVQSVIEREFESYKLLIVNDGSTDNSAEYVESLNNSKTSIVSGENLGIVGALNLGLNYVNTKYVAILDSDDKCEPSRLKAEIEYLENHPECVLVGTSIRYIGIKNSKRGVRVKLPQTHDKIVDGLKRHKFVIAHTTVMMRTDALLKCGKYNESSMPIPDIDLFVRISQEGKLANLEHIYSPFRIHEKSFTHKNLYAISKSYFNYFQTTYNSKNWLIKSIDKYTILSIYYSQVIYKTALKKYLNGKSSLWLLMIPIAGIINLPRAIYFLKEKITWQTFSLQRRK